MEDDVIVGNVEMQPQSRLEESILVPTLIHVNGEWKVTEYRLREIQEFTAAFLTGLADATELK
jgi:hypothetical protein